MINSMVDHGLLLSNVWLIMVNLMVKCMVNHVQLWSNVCLIMVNHGQKHGQLWPKAWL